MKGECVCVCLDEWKRSKLRWIVKDISNIIKILEGEFEIICKKVLDIVF